MITAFSLRNSFAWGMSSLRKICRKYRRKFRKDLLFFAHLCCRCHTKMIRNNAEELRKNNLLTKSYTIHKKKFKF